MSQNDKSKIEYKKVGICILIFLALCIFFIVIYNHFKMYWNKSINNFQNIPLVNVDSADLHFIKDDNPDLIDTPIYNYKLKINPIKKDPIPTPTNTTSSINYIYEKYENLTNNNNTNTNAKKNNKYNNNKHNNSYQNKSGIEKIDNSENTVKYLSVFMHKKFQNYNGLGQCVVITDTPLDENNKKTVMQSLMDKKCLTYLSSSNFYPVDYQLIWSSDINSDNQIFRVWRPIPIAGCAALGDVITLGTDKPALDYIPCFPITMLKQDDPPISNGLLWKTSNDMGLNCYCWSGGNINTFFASNDYKHDMFDLLRVYNMPLNFLDNNTVLTTPENKQQGIKI